MPDGWCLPYHKSHTHPLPYQSKGILPLIRWHSTVSVSHIHHLHHVPHAMIISVIFLVKNLVVVQFHPALRYHPSPQSVKTLLLRVGLYLPLPKH